MSKTGRRGQLAFAVDPTSDAVADLAVLLGREMFGGDGSGPQGRLTEEQKAARREKMAKNREEKAKQAEKEKAVPAPAAGRVEAKYLDWHKLARDPAFESLALAAAENMLEMQAASVYVALPSGGDPLLAGLLAIQGFDGLPTVVSEDELDRVVAEDPESEFYRGVSSHIEVDERGWEKVVDGKQAKVSAGDNAEQFRSGDLFPGTGVYGNGSYCANPGRIPNFNESDELRLKGREVAFKSARAYTAVGRQGPTDPAGLLRGAFSPEANIAWWAADEPPLFLSLGAKEKLTEGIPRDAMNRIVPVTREDKVKWGTMLVLNDVGRFAAANGWDAYNVPTGIVVLNRTATMVQDTSPGQPDARLGDPLSISDPTSAAVVAMFSSLRGEMFGGPGSGPHKLTDAEKAERQAGKADAPTSGRVAAKYTDWRETAKDPAFKEAAAARVEAYLLLNSQPVGPLRDWVGSEKVEVSDRTPDGWKNSTADVGLAAILAIQGFDGLPTVVSKEELDRVVAERPESQFFRGVTGARDTLISPDGRTFESRDLRVRELVEGFKSGQVYPGLGIWGNGTYVATTTMPSGGGGPHDTMSQRGAWREAQSYASDREGNPDPAGVIRGAFGEGTRFAPWDHLAPGEQDFRQEVVDFHVSDAVRTELIGDIPYGSEGVYAPETPDQTERLGTYLMMSDPGRMAAMNGYDAMNVPSGTVLLNRTAAIVQDSVPSEPRRNPMDDFLSVVDPTSAAVASMRAALTTLSVEIFGGEGSGPQGRLTEEQKAARREKMAKNRAEKQAKEKEKAAVPPSPRVPAKYTDWRQTVKDPAFIAAAIAAANELAVETRRGSDGRIEPVVGDPMLGVLAKLQGFDGLPTVVSEDELDRLVAERPASEFYRGVKGSTEFVGNQPVEVSAGEHSEAFRTGDYFPGTGVYGNGSYCATSSRREDFEKGGVETRLMGRQAAFETARAYTSSDGVQDPAGVFRGVFREDTRFAPWDHYAYGNGGIHYFHPSDRNELLKDIPRDELGRLAPATTEEKVAVGTTLILSDEGRFALANGWDAYKVPVGVVLLNRTAGIVQDAQGSEPRWAPPVGSGDAAATLLGGEMFGGVGSGPQGPRTEEQKAARREAIARNREERAKAEKEKVAAPAATGRVPAKYNDWHETIKDPAFKAEALIIAEAYIAQMAGAKTSGGLPVDFSAARPVEGKPGEWETVRGDPSLGAIAQLQGFDGLPTVVSEGDLDKVIAENPNAEFFRGVEDHPILDDEGFNVRGADGKIEIVRGPDLVEEFRSGGYFPGKGVFGNGTYVAVTDRTRLGDREGAYMYAYAYTLSKGNPDPNGMMRGAFHPDANIAPGGHDQQSQQPRLSWEDKEALRGKIPTTNPESRIYNATTREEKETLGTLLILLDEGRFAAANGYDAVRVSSGTVLLNRTAAIVQDSVPSRPSDPTSAAVASMFAQLTTLSVEIFGGEGSGPQGRLTEEQKAARREKMAKNREEKAKAEKEKAAAPSSGRVPAKYTDWRETMKDPAFIEAALVAADRHLAELANGPQGDSPFGDSMLGALAAVQGFDGLPTVVSEDEMNRLVGERPESEFYRGVKGSRAGDYMTTTTVTAAEHVEAFRTGDYYPGTGVYGNGSYCAASSMRSDFLEGDGYRQLMGRQTAYMTAVSYGGSRSGGSANREGVFRGSFREDTRFAAGGRDAISEGASVEQLHSQDKDNLLRGVPVDNWGNYLPTTREEKVAVGTVAILNDVGRFALANGWDAYKVPTGTVLLNRTAAIVQDSTPSFPEDPIPAGGPAADWLAALLGGEMFGGPGSGPHKLTDAEKAERQSKKDAAPAPVLRGPDPVVKDLPGPSKVPKLDDLLATSSMTERNRLLEQVVAGQFGEGRFTVSPRSSWLPPGDDGKKDLSFTGKILDATGHEVGTVVRSVVEKEDGKLVAINSMMGLTEDARGKGFGTAFNSHMEDWYRANGVDRIELMAANNGTSQGGSVVWAKAGFDFMPGENGVTLANIAEDMSTYGKDPATTEMVGRLNDMATAIVFGDRPSPDAPTPYEVVQLPAGERALRDVSWLGAKHLNTEGGQALAASSGTSWDARWGALAKVAKEWDHVGEEEASLESSYPDETTPAVASMFAALTTLRGEMFGGPGSGPHKLTDAEKAERQAAKGTAPKPEAVPGRGPTFDEVKADPSKLFDALKGTFGDGFTVAPPSDERSRFADPHPGPVEMRFQAQILDPSGTRVGSVVRDFTVENGERVAHSTRMVLDPEARGKGFATAFNNRMEDWYRGNGVGKVVMRAEMDGRAVWAKAGYDWLNPEMKSGRDASGRKIAAGSGKALDELSKSKDLDKSMRTRLKGDRSDPGYPTPFEVVSSPGGEKALKSGTGWDAVKVLSPVAGLAASASSLEDRRRMLAEVAAGWDHDGEEEASLAPYDPTADAVASMRAALTTLSVEMFGGDGSGPQGPRTEEQKAARRETIARNKEAKAAAERALRPEGKTGSFALEGKVPEADRAMIEATMKELTERFPIGHVRVIFGSGDDAITGYATAQGGDPLVPSSFDARNGPNPELHGSQAIHINADAWEASKTAEGYQTAVDAALAKAGEERWDRGGKNREEDMKGLLVDSSGKGTFTHEYGHLVDHAMVRAGADPAHGGLTEVTPNGVMISVPNSAGYTGFDSPSAYASENSAEMAAELFGAYVSGGSQSRVPATADRVAAYGALVEKYVGKR